MSGVNPTTTLSALLEGGSDRLFRSVAETVWRSAQRISAINDLLAAQVGLSPPQYSIIMILVYEPQGIPINTLAERLAVSQPFVTREIKQLVNSGFVTKRANPEDGRSVLVSLSKKANAAVATLTALIQETNDILFKDITREEFLFLKGFTARIAMQSNVAFHYAQLRFKLAKRKDNPAKRSTSLMKKRA